LGIELSAIGGCLVSNYLFWLKHSVTHIFCMCMWLFPLLHTSNMFHFCLIVGNIFWLLNHRGGDCIEWSPWLSCSRLLILLEQFGKFIHLVCICYSFCYYYLICVVLFWLWQHIFGLLKREYWIGDWIKCCWWLSGFRFLSCWNISLSSSILSVFGYFPCLLISSMCWVVLTVTTYFGLF